MRKYFFALCSAICVLQAGCDPMDELLKGDLAFDGQGAPYIIGSTVSERSFVHLVSGKCLEVQEDEIEIVSHSGRTTEKVSEFEFLPIYSVMPSTERSLRKMFYYDEGEYGRYGVHQDYDYSVLNDGTVTDVNTGEILMRVINIGERSFDAFIQVRKKSSESFEWAFVTYSVVRKASAMYQDSFPYEYCPSIAYLDESGYPYLKDGNFDISKYITMVDGCGWKVEDYYCSAVNIETGRIEPIVANVNLMKFSVEGEKLTFYYDIMDSDDPLKIDMCFNDVECEVLQNGSVVNKSEGRIEFRVVSLGMNRFYAFVKVGSKYLYLKFDKMSDEELKFCQDNYRTQGGWDLQQ